MFCTASPVSWLNRLGGRCVGRVGLRTRACLNVDSGLCQRSIFSLEQAHILPSSGYSSTSTTPTQFFVRPPSRSLCLSAMCRRQAKVEDPDDPVKFSSSKAAEWRVQQTYGNPLRLEDQPPSSQAYVVIASIAAFLIYFCILREENDWDEYMNLNLYERLNQLEQEQLEEKLALHESGKQILSPGEASLIKQKLSKLMKKDMDAG
ncbi:unnamed protein product [Darwinula stevensoni]|uniref:Uncharacterized protein n=1 Tax=Darwinula stevensoni TaxID=69355 RepID=A0A7R9ABC3_9CRUS|nr:unnamed protein product [Darwinula stevensoni]CAG0899075.1 unnamed protein product [Darwinula stevensoni]